MRADFVVTADAQSYGIILAVTYIRKSYTAQNPGIECARRPETVDTERIVSSVVASPLAMVDKTGGDLFQRKSTIV